MYSNHKNVTVPLHIPNRQIHYSAHKNYMTTSQTILISPPLINKRGTTRTHHTPYGPGDHVWLYQPRVPCGKTRTLTPYWTGPYVIVKRCSEVTYVIRKLGDRKENIAHYNHIKPYTHRRPPVRPGNTQPRSPPTCSPPTSVDKAQEDRPQRQPRMPIRLDEYIIDTDMT